MIAVNKALILVAILLYASIRDIKTREVPDFVPIMVAILGLVNVQDDAFSAMLFGAVAVFLPQIVVSLLDTAKAIGGADIKIMTAAGFMLGAQRGLFALTLGLALSVVVTIIIRAVKKLPKDTSYALIPYLSVGILTAYFI